MLSKVDDLELSLEYHGQLVEKVGKGIAQTKKRLYDAELILNLEPPPDEKQLLQQWTVVVNDVLTKKTPMHFPNLRRMKRDQDLQRQIAAQTQNVKRTSSKQKWQRHEKEQMEKQAQNLRNMVLHKDGKFGGSVKGEPLRTIQNYQGANCIYSGSRTLVRKEGNTFGDSGTALPPWFGPQYYEIPLSDDRPPTHYQVPFKSPGRKEVPDGVNERNAIFRRRQQVRECHSPNHTPSVVSSTQTLKEFLMLNDDSTVEVGDDFGIPADIEKCDIDEADNHLNKPKSSYLVDREALPKKNYHPSASTTSYNTTLKSQSKYTNSTFESTMNAGNKHEPPPRINPIHVNHEYALKILATEERQARKWQVPDFTKGALLRQPPVRFDEYRIEDTFAEEENMQQLTHQTKANMDSERAIKAGDKYTADIFFMKPSDYRPPTILLPNYKNTSANSSRVASPALPSRISSPVENLRRSRPNSRPDLKSSKPENDANNLNLDGLNSNQSVHDVVNSWCKTHGVINSRGRRDRKKHDDFLNKHPKLPSIELSLSGLLLEGNPYTEKDDIIQKNPGFDLDQIKV